ncbi:MAG: hypothetical protein IKQ58_02710 [Prevotella sp.]|nr:hypothetical protein [Prevotella sp.]MBR6867430.1 hypothetical protein [Prevotella sp.]
MIDYVKGLVGELTPATATIECGGVGYLCQISLNTYAALQGKTEGKLFVYEAIREDAWVLFGFASKTERELFLLLIGVSGVGVPSEDMRDFLSISLSNSLQNSSTAQKISVILSSVIMRFVFCVD